MGWLLNAKSTAKLQNDDTEMEFTLKFIGDIIINYSCPTSDRYAITLLCASFDVMADLSWSGTNQLYAMRLFDHYHDSGADQLAYKAKLLGLSPFALRTHVRQQVCKLTELSKTDFAGADSLFRVPVSLLATRSTQGNFNFSLFKPLNFRTLSFCSSFTSIRYAWST